MKKSEAEALLNTFKTEISKSIKTTVTKETPKSRVNEPGENQHISEVKENYMLVKFIKGAVFGDWENAANEQAYFKKALGADLGSRGGFLVPQPLASGIIEMLKEKAKVRTMPGVRTLDVPLGSKMEFNRGKTGPSTAWGAENTEISEDTGIDLERDSLEPKKNVCLYKTSRELVLAASESVEDYVRREVSEEMALEEDKVILQGTGGTQPLGIYYHPRVVSTDLSATIDFDDILNAMYNVRLENGDEINGWICHPRTVNTLRKLKDGNGRYLYTDGGPSVGNIPNFYGAPLVQTTKIDITGRPDSNESYVIGGVWSQLILTSEQGMRIETTDSGGDAFKNDQVWIKFVRGVGSMLRHPEQFVVIKGIQA